MRKKPIQHRLVTAGLFLDVGNTGIAASLLADIIEDDSSEELTSNQIAETLDGLALVAFLNHEFDFAQSFLSPVAGSGQSNRGAYLEQLANWIHYWSDVLNVRSTHAKAQIEHIVTQQAVSMCGFVPAGDQQISELVGWLENQLAHSYENLFESRLKRKGTNCMGWDGKKPTIPQHIVQNAKELSLRQKQAASLPIFLHWLLDKDETGAFSKHLEIILPWLEAGHLHSPFSRTMTKNNNRELDRRDLAALKLLAESTWAVANGKGDCGSAEFIGALLQDLEGLEQQAYGKFHGLARGTSGPRWIFPARIGMAHILHRQGMYRQGIEVLGKIESERDIERMMASYLLAWLHMRAGDKNVARQILSGMGATPAHAKTPAPLYETERIELLRKAALRDLSRI